MKSTVCWGLFITVGLFIDVEAGLRILGGRDALKDEFSFAVRLENLRSRIKNPKLKDYFQFCSGAAIASTWILTAAHCCDEEDQKPHIKQFARCNSYFPNILGQLSALFEFYVHPAYKPYNNDIALFRCEKLPISSFAKISAIDYSSIVGYEAVILGYGKTNASQFDKPLQVLKGMFSKCPYLSSNKKTLCIRLSCGAVATVCGGDSGGPVLFSSHIVGLTSTSHDDCSEDTSFFKPTPGSPADIVLMVSPYLNWIQKVVSSKPSEL